MATPEPLTTQVGEPVEALGHPAAVETPLARPTSAWQRARIAVDAAMLVAATFVAQLGAQQAGVPDTPLVWLLLFGALVVGISYFRGAYEWRGPRPALHTPCGGLTPTGPPPPSG